VCCETRFDQNDVEAQMTQVAPRTIQTNAGNLELVPVKNDQLGDMARYWPMGLVEIPDTPGQFGLVFQRGDQEVHGIKLQPPDMAEEDATFLQNVNRALIASALKHYLEERHRGVMVPCVYYKEKAPGEVETGFAFFVGPDAKSKSASREHSDAMYDDRLGAGATPMVFAMSGAIAKAGKELDLPMSPLIGVDLRPRLAIGGLAMHFVIVGPQVFVVKYPIEEAEPTWEYLVRAGFSTLPYAPMRPTALSYPTPA